MAAITRLAKTVTTRIATSSDTFIEATGFTISWTDLTTAGFVNGANVLILVRLSHGASNIANLFSCELRKGSTFAGAAALAGSVSTVEPARADSADDGTPMAGHHYGFLVKTALVTDDNLYLAVREVNATAASLLIDDISILILNLDDLGVDDWRYAEVNHGAVDAPTAYDASGASVTVPGRASDNDWLLLSFSHWLIDDVAADVLMALSWGGSDFGEMQEEGENIGEERAYTITRYVTGVVSNTTLQARYRSDTATTQDCNYTRVFALRLSAFRDHAGVQTDPGGNDLTHSVLDTLQEFAGLGTYAHGGAGGNDLIILAATVMASSGDANKSPYGRIQVGGLDWPVAGIGREGGAHPHGTTDGTPWLLFGMKSETNGTLDIDADVAEAVDVSPTYQHTYHTLVAFSAELAAAGAPVALTGTAVPATDEVALRAGGKTKILTLTGDTWVAVGATFDAERQGIINAFVNSVGTEWNAERPNIPVTAVLRTSDTVATITLPALAGFDITAQETVAAPQIPATALTGGVALTADQGFVINPAAPITVLTDEGQGDY